MQQPASALPSLSREQRALFFRYDPSLPLEIEEQPPELAGGVQIVRFALASIHQQRVRGILWLPAGRQTPAPTMLIQHGAGSYKEDGYIRLPAMRWANAGWACVAIDAAGHGERSGRGFDPAWLWRAPWFTCDHAVQMAVDLMRTVDYLATRPDIDAGRLGYLGFSMGTIMGVSFVALDQRIRSACFAIGGSLRYHDGVDPQLRREGETVATIIDPVHFAPLIAPRPVLQINGLADELVPPDAAERLHAALGEPKRIIWYEGGHRGLRVPQFLAMFDFFQQTLT